MSFGKYKIVFQREISSCPGKLDIRISARAQTPPVRWDSVPNFGVESFVTGGLTARRSIQIPPLIWTQLLELLSILAERSHVPSARVKTI